MSKFKPGDVVIVENVTDFFKENPIQIIKGFYNKERLVYKLEGFIGIYPHENFLNSTPRLIQMLYGGKKVDSD